MIRHLIKVGIVMVVVFFLCFLLNMHSFVAPAFIMFLIYIVIYLIMRFISDTRKTRIENHKFVRIMAITSLRFLPYLILLGVGIFFASIADTYLEVAIDVCYKKTDNIIKYVERTEDVFDSYWYKPWTYIWENKSSKTILEPVVEKVSFYQKLFFSLIYSLLRCLQIFLYCAFAFWGLSRFADLYVKTSLQQGVIIKYQWCSHDH